jgi:hypothetical protein
VSGADFVLFRWDGVLELDGRITIRAHDGSLIDAAYRGLIDLCEEGQGSEVANVPREVVRRALRGTLSGEDNERAEGTRTALREVGNVLEEYFHHKIHRDRRVVREQLEKELSSAQKPSESVNLERTRALAAFDEETNKVWQIQVLDPIVDEIARALPDKDGFGLRGAVENAVKFVAIEDPVEKALGAAGLAKETASQMMTRIVEGATSALGGHRFRGSALGDLCEALRETLSAEKRGRLLADTLERAITREYRAQELGIYEDLLNAAAPGAKPEFDVMMPIVFETASGPWSDAPGEDMSWIGSAYRVNENRFWQYRSLVRRPFVASGKVSFAEGGIRGRPPSPDQIALDVYGLT